MCNNYIDSRAFSEEKIKPPPPLPLVSRRALKRVINPLAIPTTCKYCGLPLLLVNNQEIYKRPYGQWPYAYLCKPCHAYVGLHPFTDIPMGTLADAGLREQRKRSKALFIEMIKSNNISRDVAYTWLAEKLGIEKPDCHFGWFNEDDCERAYDILVKRTATDNVNMCYAEIRRKW